MRTRDEESRVCVSAVKIYFFQIRIISVDQW